MGDHTSGILHVDLAEGSLSMEHGWPDEGSSGPDHGPEVAQVEIDEQGRRPHRRGGKKGQWNTAASMK